MMYTERLHMSPRIMALIAAPFVFTQIVLSGVLVFVPIPVAGRIPIYGAMMLEAVIGLLLLTSLSQIRIAIDDQTLTIAFRMLFTKRIALTRILTCTPTDAPVWGMSYQYRGRRYRARSNATRAVVLELSNGAQVIFSTRHADAVCTALRTHRPAIARI